MSVRVAEKSKITRKRDGAKSERLKPTDEAGQDRPTAERQNRGNPAAQSHGSKTVIRFTVKIARLPKSNLICRDDRVLVIPAFI